MAFIFVCSKEFATNINNTFTQLFEMQTLHTHCNNIQNAIRQIGCAPETSRHVQELWQSRDSTVSLNSTCMHSSNKHDLVPRCCTSSSSRIDKTISIVGRKFTETKRCWCGKWKPARTCKNHWEHEAEFDSGCSLFSISGFGCWWTFVKGSFQYFSSYDVLDYL